MERSAPLPDTPGTTPQARPPAGELDAPIRSKELFNNRSCVFIEHEGMVYALRATRTGKLILTK
ncbi:hemin uptake protein HemP [Zoogloea sp.]|uniref:hemin uptake protein HemP n=1 Tax=Zoogloea sp. TaxID=49181 RepID=UPI001415E07C|nr:MAG: hemin uptake protein HemP [Zoogloea sp.]